MYWVKLIGLLNLSYFLKSGHLQGLNYMNLEKFRGLRPGPNSHKASHYRDVCCKAYMLAKFHAKNDHLQDWFKIAYLKIVNMQS